MNFPELVNTLVDIYKKSNTRIIGGYPNHFTNTSEASLFNYVLKNNKIISTSGSISNDELFVIYNLSKYINPTNIYIIGNSYGISTIFLSLLFPKSNLVAIDKYRTEGIKFTNNLLKKFSNFKKVIKGDSPNDNRRIIQENFNNQKLDLVLIDGLHTNRAQSNDYYSIEKFLSKKSVVIFHDVINHKMFKSYNNLTKKYKLNNYLLTKTSSGMALSFKSKNLNLKLKKYLQFLSDDIDTVIKLGKISKKQTKPKLTKKLKSFKIAPHPQK